METHGAVAARSAQTMTSYDTKSQHFWFAVEVLAVHGLRRLSTMSPDVMSALIALDPSKFDNPWRMLNNFRIIHSLVSQIALKSLLIQSRNLQTL